MRSLTEAEARVIAVLLGMSSSPERDRLRRSQLPRSTYHAARRRAYDEGWLRDRYVPEPERFGWTHSTVAVARPYADRLDELIRSWSADPGNVLLWASAQLALSVTFHSGEAAARKAAAVLGDRRAASWSFVVPAALDQPSIPVYFDYEGLWSHLAGLSGTVAYPRGMGGVAPPADGGAPPASEHQRWAAGELVHRPFLAAEQGRPGHLIGPFGLPFSQEKLLQNGWVRHRVFLEPSHLPPYRGNLADEVIFVGGELRAQVAPESLFQALTRDCHVFPFLYVVGGGRVLIGAMGRSGAPPASATSTAPGRRPVMATLRAALEGIEIVQESASRLGVRSDHRYDRLLPRRPAG